MPALFCGRKKMTTALHYTTNLSKAQGMVAETFELLELWEPGMTVGELKARVRATGALGKATQVRVDDLVGRAFAQRYLIDGGKPAQWLSDAYRAAMLSMPGSVCCRNGAPRKTRLDRRHYVDN